MRQKLPRYEYINLDSGWSNDIDEYGRWIYRDDLFPLGLAALSKVLSSNQHKLGIYLVPGIPVQAGDHHLPIEGTSHHLGEYTQQRRPGNVFRGLTYMPDRHDAILQQYFDSMAHLFASWGIRYVKIDGCGPGSGDQISPHLAPDCRPTLRMMSRAFRRYAIWTELSWYMDAAYADEWAIMANGARIYIDIESYSSRTMTSTTRVLDRFHHVPRWVDKRQVIGAHAGFYVDLDAVLVGMTTPWNARCIDGLDNDGVRRSYISFWAMVSSVFCIGADPRLLPPKYIDMLHHDIVLDIQQSGVLAVPLPFTDYWHYRQVWWKTLVGYGQEGEDVVCVGLFNTYYYPMLSSLDNKNNQQTDVGFIQQWLDLEVGFKLADLGLTRTARIKDVWTGRDLGVFTDTYTTRLDPGECQLVLVSPHL
ncbi:glycoside hydrolase superfamily [Chlamydoabsidia padenii]|nr:glycoside hydrolase superfamily [Chlamydoabsidia padenii]